MRFGLITPVFDGCIESLELLYGNIAVQTHESWVWVLCGNKFSEKMLGFAKSKQDLDGRGRIVYLTTNLKEDGKNTYFLIANISKRRNICIKRMKVDYFFTINADSRILDKEMLSKISSKLEEEPKNLCIYKITHINGDILPKFPFVDGGIDALNFCVSSNTAKKVGYPTNADFRKLNDWRFFVRVFEECKGDYCFVNEVFAEFNGNNRYKNVLSIMESRWNKTLRGVLLDYVSYCLHDNYLLGLIGVIKELLVVAGVTEGVLFAEKTYA